MPKQHVEPSRAMSINNLCHYGISVSRRCLLRLPHTLHNMLIEDTRAKVTPTKDQFSHQCFANSYTFDSKRICKKILGPSYCQGSEEVLTGIMILSQKF